MYFFTTQGLKPWIELSYGNSKYPNGGEEGPGAGLPNSTAALEGYTWKLHVSFLCFRAKL